MDGVWKSQSGVEGTVELLDPTPRPLEWRGGENPDHLTPPRRGRYVSLLIFRRTLPPNSGVIAHETDVQASQSEAEEQARLPGPDEEEGGAEDAEPEAEKGSEAPHRADWIEVRAEVAGSAPRQREEGRGEGEGRRPHLAPESG